MSFAKLDSGIVNSTLWVLPDDVLRVWIWLLSQADAQGVVRTAAPALALVCMKSVDRIREIMLLLESPDPDSRSEVEEGRRLRKVLGGWQIINYRAYRERVAAEEKRENDRVRIASKRAADRESSSQVVESSGVSQPVANVAQAEAEVEEEAEESRAQDEAPAAPAPRLKFRSPEWIDGSTWTAFLEMRRRIRKPTTDRACALIVTELIKLRANGHDPTAVLEQSIRNGWQDVFEVREKGVGGRRRDGAESARRPGGSPSVPREDPMQAELAHLKSLFDYGRISREDHEAACAEVRRRFGGGAA